MRMLHDAWYLARTDCSQAIRRRETWFWVFLLPLVFFYFIGTITMQFAGTPQVGDPIEVVAPPDAGFLADDLIKRLEKAGFRVSRVESANAPVRQRRLILPAGFTASVQAVKPVKIELQHRDSSAGGDYEKLRLSRILYGMLADWIVVLQGGGQPDAATLDAVREAERLLKLEVKAAGKRKVIPTGFEQAVPGNMVFFLLMNLLTVSAVMLVVGREQGILRRLASAPMSRQSIVLGKWGGRMMIAAVQIAYSMGAGTLLFGVHWGENYWMVLLVLLSFASFSTALGFLIGTYVKTRGQAGAIGSLSANLMAALGGCWWPIEIMPQSMQTLSLYMPSGLAMSALHQLVNFGNGAMSALPQLLVLFTGALVAGALAARSFRFQ
ncbi:MAG: ABC transporter permease [Acidobacteria bacterium]|nr:ABC transporter permease [Acidobacteriota bacterium]